MFFFPELEKKFKTAKAFEKNGKKFKTAKKYIVSTIVCTLPTSFPRLNLSIYIVSTNYSLIFCLL
jgi:hypothetical protein